jgi:hypothetical protein
MTENQLILPDDFFLPFGGTLNKENRWVILTSLIPWWKAEEKYAKTFKKTFRGQKSVSVRIALGALIIQTRLGTSDRETVEQKQSKDSPDDPDDSDPSNGGTASDRTGSPTQTQPNSNQGKLLLDATCAPADIAYPTDLTLLNEAREKLEQLIDVLHAPHRGIQPKRRTYRQKARKAYLAVAKQRHVKHRTLRKAVGQQLRFVARNLRIIMDYQQQSSLTLLSKQQYKQLLVIHELYRQQSDMYAKRSHRIEDRIVSIINLISVRLCVEKQKQAWNSALKSRSVW